MGKLVSKLGQATGLVADPDAGSGAFAEADALARRAVAELEKLGVPSVEAQKIALQLPEVVGAMEAEQLDASAYEDIIEDPQLRERIVDAIGGMEELSETGFGVEDRARLDAMRRATQADEQARQASIMQSFAERGALGSGSELAARLASSQGTADRAAQEAVELAAQGQAQRRQALGDMASMSAGLRGADLQKSTNLATARDRFAEFNALQRAQAAQQNLSEQQRIAENRTGLQNQQQIHNKGLIQQDYQNRYNKATGVANQVSNLANTQIQRGQREAAAAQAQAAATRGLVGSAFTAAGGVPGIMAGASKVGSALSNPVGAFQQATGTGAFAAPAGGVGPMPRNVYKDGGTKYNEGGISKDKIEGMIEALEMLKQGPNQIVNNPYTQSAEESAMEDIVDSDVRPMMRPDKGMPIPTNVSGALYNEGGVESPVSYAADGMRIDEKIDNGELAVDENAQDELMNYLRGNLDSEDMSEGRIIEGESYSGDLLPDRINSGELVANVAQQDKVKKDIEDKDAELEGYRKLIKLLGKM